MKRIRVQLGRWRRRSTRPFYTILILPHARSRFRKLHVSRPFVRTLGVMALLVVGLGLWAPHLLFKSQTQSATVENLRADNARLREDRESFDAALGALSEKLERFENEAGRIADALGVKEPGSAEPAGGPSASSPRLHGERVLDGELELLRQRSDTLESSLDRLDGLFSERMELLSSTPNVMPVQGWFSHGFGWRKDPFDGSRQFHRGIDIVADRGTQVRAPADGLVSRAIRVRDYGKSIDLSHGYGYVTRYAHLHEILVKPGQRIKRGDVIGRVGSTGRSTGPHLHYEVFRDGRRVNPWKYLGQKGR